LILLAHDDSNRVGEAADIDKAEIEREECATGNEPDDNQGQLGVPNRERIEDNFRENLGDGPKCLIDRFVDSQGVLLVGPIVQRTLAADRPSTTIFCLGARGFRSVGRAKVAVLRGPRVIDMVLSERPTSGEPDGT
jgi:hypothetical protein